MNPDTDILISFRSPEQKIAFVKFMMNGGPKAVCESPENKELKGNEKIEAFYVEAEDDGTDCNYINVE